MFVFGFANDLSYLCTGAHRPRSGLRPLKPRSFKRKSKLPKPTRKNNRMSMWRSSARKRDCAPRNFSRAKKLRSMRKRKKRWKTDFEKGDQLFRVDLFTLFTRTIDHWAVARFRQLREDRIEKREQRRAEIYAINLIMSKWNEAQMQVGW